MENYYPNLTKILLVWEAVDAENTKTLTFALSTGSANIFLLAETLSSPGVTLAAPAPVLVTLTGFTISISRVAIVARETRVAVPASSVAQTRETLTSDVVTVPATADVLVRITL